MSSTKSPRAKCDADRRRPSRRETTYSCRILGAGCDGLSLASYSVTFHPIAFAASTAPSEGTWLLLVACPAEITTMDLFFTAGRDVGSTGRFVPFSAAAVAVTAA